MWIGILIVRHCLPIVQLYVWSFFLHTDFISTTYLIKLFVYMYNKNKLINIGKNLALHILWNTENNSF